MHIKLADIDEFFYKNTYYLKALVLRCMNNFYFICFRYKKCDSTTPI